MENKSVWDLVGEAFDGALRKYKQEVTENPDLLKSEYGSIGIKTEHEADDGNDSNV